MQPRSSFRLPRRVPPETGLQRPYTASIATRLLIVKHLPPGLSLPHVAIQVDLMQQRVRAQRHRSQPARQWPIGEDTVRISME